MLIKTVNLNYFVVLYLCPSEDHVLTYPLKKRVSSPIFEFNSSVFLKFKKHNSRVCKTESFIFKSKSLNPFLRGSNKS